MDKSGAVDDVLGAPVMSPSVPVMTHTNSPFGADGVTTEPPVVDGQETCVHLDIETRRL